MDQKSIIFLQIAIAIITLPIQYFGSDFLKISLFPYVLFLLFSKKADYIPALVIYSLPGNTISLLIILGCFLISIINYRILKKMKIGFILKGLLILAPIFLYSFYELFFIKGVGFSLTFNYLSYYLGFFCLFYGVLVAPKFKQIHLNSIILVCFLLPLIMFIPSHEEKIVIRLFWLALPLSMTILLKGFFNIKLKINSTLGIFSFLFIFLIAIPYGLKLTPVLSGIISIIILASLSKSSKIVYKILNPKILSIFIFLFLMLALSLGQSNIQSNKEYDIDSEIDNFSSLLSYINFKAIDDRAVIWAGVIKEIDQNLLYLPTGSALKINFINSSGHSIEESDYGAHNVLLELIRQYGLICGISLSIFLIIIFSRFKVIFQNSKNSLLILFSASLLGLGISELFFGQALIMSIFSFTFFSMIGLCYGSSIKPNLIFTHAKKD